MLLIIIISYEVCCIILFKNESENIYLQFMAANSLIYSAQYTKPAIQQQKKRFDIALKVNCL